ncbi:MAG: hypothetical protein Q8R70_07435 [Methanoregula sp.]|nr:hypothetical protein [Methanoregula sp.]
MGSNPGDFLGFPDRPDRKRGLNRGDWGYSQWPRSLELPDNNASGFLIVIDHTGSLMYIRDLVNPYFSRSKKICCGIHGLLAVLLLDYQKHVVELSGPAKALVCIRIGRFRGYSGKPSLIFRIFVSGSNPGIF